MKQIWFLMKVWGAWLRVNLLHSLSKLLKKGSGTSYPGIWIERSQTDVIDYFNSKYQEVIFISGTNGKTTTRAMIVNGLEQAGKKVCTNRSGANIFRGIVTSLFLDLNLFLQPRSEVLVLEVEEATLPRLAKHIKGYRLLLTNIFRDQLDAYGEIDATLRFFTESLLNAKQVIVNADDQKLLGSIAEYEGEIVGFSMAGQQYELAQKQTQIDYKDIYRGTVRSSTLAGTEVSISHDQTVISIPIQLTGEYNALNAVAAYATIQSYGDLAIEGISQTKPVFGRGEIIEFDGRKLYIYLVKNPAGFDRVLDLFEGLEIPEQLMVLINDNIADGKDVSWLWDIQLEQFVAAKPSLKYLTGGIRGLDMLLRLEYAEAPVSVEDYKKSVAESVDYIINTNKDTVVLATYTAMRQFRMELARYTDISGETAEGN